MKHVYTKTNIFLLLIIFVLWLLLQWSLGVHNFFLNPLNHSIATIILIAVIQYFKNSKKEQNK